mmetsp:Transcript_147351/g.257544  ORF Transcript_147351/g.257544 Transcript_147351/m.257544 type:complete len:331 (-) Transcript_147351:543-1535(-)
MSTPCPALGEYSVSRRNLSSPRAPILMRWSNCSPPARCRDPSHSRRARAGGPGGRGPQWGPMACTGSCDRSRSLSAVPTTAWPRQRSSRFTSCGSVRPVQTSVRPSPCIGPQSSGARSWEARHGHGCAGCRRLSQGLLKRSSRGVRGTNNPVRFLSASMPNHSRYCSRRIACPPVHSCSSSEVRFTSARNASRGCGAPVRRLRVPASGRKGPSARYGPTRVARLGDMAACPWEAAHLEYCHSNEDMGGPSEVCVLDVPQCSQASAPCLANAFSRVRWSSSQATTCTRRASLPACTTAETKSRLGVRMRSRRGSRPLRLRFAAYSRAVNCR